MATISIGGFELAFGTIIGIILLSIFNNIGQTIAKVYFEPFLKDFKQKHDKFLNGGKK